MRVQITVTGAASAQNLMLDVQRKFKGTKKPVLVDIAKRLAERIVSNIDAAAVKPLSETTLRIRRTRKNKPANSSSTPLVDTGEMRSRVKTFVSDTVAQAASDKFYAGFVQLGIRNTSGAVPGKVIPGRPFMLLHPDDIAWAQEQILNYVVSEGERRAAA